MSSAPTLSSNKPPALSIRLVPVADFSTDLLDLELEAVGIGADEALYLLGRDDADDHVVVGSEGTERIRVHIEDDVRDFHHVQPLPDSRVLLVDGRCEVMDGTELELNAAIYEADGTLVGDLTLGDGVNHVQATYQGRIWVAYFDEGICADVPIGGAGLVCFDGDGEPIFEYDAEAAGTDVIDDCYALNVPSDDETWVYFYSSFPLVRIRDGKQYAAFRGGVHGASAFAVGDGHVLFAGGYDSPRCALCEIGDGELRRVADFVFEGVDGEPIDFARVQGRGPQLHWLHRGAWYRVDIRELVRHHRR